MNGALARSVDPADQQVAEEAFVDLKQPDFQAFWLALVWRFRHKNPAKDVVSINWRFALPRGGFSTDPQQFILLESFKTVVWGMLTSDAYGKKLSIGTLTPMVGGIREAFRWFTWVGVKDFAQVTAALQEQYLGKMTQLILAKNEVYPNFLAEGYEFGYHSPSLRLGVDEVVEEEDTAELNKEAEDDGVTYAQVANRINTLYYIHSQRELLAKRKLGCFQEAPFKGRSAGEVASSIVAHAINRIPALPAAVSIPMLDEVFRWVDVVGPLVKRAHLDYHASKSAGSRAMVSVFKQLDDVGFSMESLACMPWRERNEGRGDGLGDPLFFGHHRMRLAVMTVRDASVLALQYLAGLRISEVCSLQVLKTKNEGLPSCIYKRQSHDGLMDLYFLRGLLVKGQLEPETEGWVIGCCPHGSKEMPILVRALNLLHDVVSPFLNDETPSPLFVHFNNGWGMPASAESVNQASGVDLQRGCRRFVRCFVDLSKLPDFDRHGNSLVRYRQSQGQCIRTHQGRKTFAEFCLKTNSAALSALSIHFKHLKESITQAGYFAPIQRLHDDVEMFGHTATVDFFVSRSEKKVVFGAMAEVVNRFFDEFKLNGIKDIIKLREKVTEIVIMHDLRIYFHEHGNCLISIAPMKSRCQAASGGAAWFKTRPDERTRTVSMCGGCDCLALDRSHLPYYEERAGRWKAAAKDRTNTVAVRTYEQSKKIVRILKAKIDDAHQCG